jgi:hypothetical protein
MARTFSQNGGKLTLQKITFSQDEGSQEKGRPKLRCLDNVLKDMKLL